jgi:hypothetical protein
MKLLLIDATKIISATSNYVKKSYSNNNVIKMSIAEGSKIQIRLPCEEEILNTTRV